MASTGVAERTHRKITRRLMPFLFVLYIISYLDRVNLGYASLEMTRELDFSNEVFGFGAGIFFVGYFGLPGGFRRNERAGCRSRPDSTHWRSQENRVHGFARVRTGGKIISDTRPCAG